MTVFRIASVSHGAGEVARGLTALSALPEDWIGVPGLTLVWRNVRLQGT